MIFDWRDAVYTFRVVCNRPFVPILAVLALALGITVNATFFGLIDAIILRPIPVLHPDELVRVLTLSPTGRIFDDRLTLPMFQALRDRSHVFAGIFAWEDDGLRNMRVGDARFLGLVDQVTGDFFRTVGGSPLMGRWIIPSDVDLGTGQSSPVAVLSYRCWRERYHADPQVLGQSMMVDGIPLTIVGVAKPEFSEIDIDLTSDAIVPLGFAGKYRGWSYHVTARLKPDISLAQARTEVATLWPSILRDAAEPGMEPQERDLYFARKIELASEFNGDSVIRDRYSQPLMVLMGLSAMILLVTCINLASILLARSLSRRPEFQVRLALGAGRWQLFRLVLIEAFLISFTGSVIGTAGAFGGTHLLINLFWDGYVSAGLHLLPDLRVLLFMVSAASLTAILFGLVPAIKATQVGPAPFSLYNQGTAKGQFRAGKGLIMFQVAFAFVLVTVALMFAYKLHGLSSVNLGYDRNHVLVMTLFDQAKHHKLPPSYYRQLTDELQKIPGAESVSGSGVLLARNFQFLEPVSASDRKVSAEYEWVAPDFFHLLKIPVLEGREFGWQDDEAAPGVAVLSRTLASRLFPHEDPIGRKVDFGVTPEIIRQEKDSGKGLTVVGVVQDAALFGPQTQYPIAIYLSLMQRDDVGDPLVLIRTAINPMAIARLSERTVQTMGYHFSIRTEPLERRFNRMLTVERLSSWLSQAFAGAALLLVSLGLYGLISYIVDRRYTEIGIRFALGAPRFTVLVSLLYDALSTVVVGILMGAPLAWGATHALAARYVDIERYSAGGILGALLILMFAAGLSGYLPAVQASRIDPASALRRE
ncbi:MAG TPA: ADOP family duplicated permease [Terriglobales bacterium]|nr:ADOP family duplicated permease [Terriglobales bacterium]